MKKIILLLFIPGILSAQKRLESNQKDSFIQYEMSHPMHDWTAESKSSKAVILLDENSEKITAVAVSVPVKSFDSKNANRDSHAFEVLEILKFPNISFTANNIEDHGNKIIAKGNLNFHGIAKPLEITAQKSISGKTIKVEGEFAINIKDYEVSPPSLMGIKTKEHIKINFLMVFNSR